jgi:hypothetical protein
MGFAELEPRTLAVSDIPLPVAGGTAQTVQLTAQPAAVGCKKGAVSDIQAIVRHFPFAYAPVRKGDVLGNIEYRRNGHVIAEAELQAAADIPAAPAPERSWFDRLLKRKNQR